MPKNFQLNDDTSSGCTATPCTELTITKLPPADDCPAKLNGHVRMGKRQSVMSSPFRALAFTQGALADACAQHRDMLRAVGVAALIVGWHAFIGESLWGAQK